MAARAEDLLPVEYFHLVFTLPAEIARIVETFRRGERPATRAPPRKAAA